MTPMEDAIAPPPDQRIAEAERAVIEAAIRWYTSDAPGFLEPVGKATRELLRLRAERDGRVE